jgi:hypothetical protein
VTPFIYQERLDLFAIGSVTDREDNLTRWTVDTADPSSCAGLQPRASSASAPSVSRAARLRAGAPRSLGIERADRVARPRTMADRSG